MKHKYFDIVPSARKKLAPDEFRRALRGAGFKPVDSGQYRWRSVSAEEIADINDVYLVDFPEPCILFSNTQTLKINCPKCGKDISICEWHGILLKWREKCASSFVVQTPCCGSDVDIREFLYEPKVFFASTAITVCTPNSATAPHNLIRRLETTLGNRLECIERLC